MTLLSGHSPIAVGLPIVNQDYCHNNNQANHVRVKTTLEIYTDWANHYLERRGTTANLTKSISLSNSKLNGGHNIQRNIVDLTTDLQDGVLLIEIVESVTNTKITSKKISTKPKNSSQMIDNIDACLQFLLQLGINLDGISANDIFDGNLKSILSLFFNLSRYKQAIKAQQQQQISVPVQHLHHHNSSESTQHLSQQNRIGVTTTPSITPSAAMLSKLPFANNNNKANAKNSCSAIPVGPKKANVGGSIPSSVSSSIAKCASTQDLIPAESAPTPHPTPPLQSTNSSKQSANQTTTQIPTKGIRASRPSSTSSIPQISGPSVNAKTNVILRNKPNGCTQQQSQQPQQTIVDKIRQNNKLSNGEQSVSQIHSNSVIVSNNRTESNISKRISSSSGLKANVSNFNRNYIMSAKPTSLSSKRIQPPRSRPTSTLIDNNTIASTMSTSQSSFNTLQTTISKPTAAVKGTFKVFATEDNRKSTKKLENQSSTSGQTTEMNGNCKKAIDSDKCPQFPILYSKPEPSIVMVSPIMSRDKNNATFKTIEEEEKNLKKYKQFYSKNSTKSSKKCEDKQNKSDNKSNQIMSGDPHQSSESSLMDSTSSSIGEGEESTSNSDVDLALVNIKPMPPLVRTSQFAFLKNNQISQLCNGTAYSRFPNNYSTIENGYMSDCALLNSSRPNSRGYYSVTGSTTGYVSETDVCSPQIKRNQFLTAREEYPPSPTHRNYATDTDSLKRAANTLHNDNQMYEIRKLRRQLDQANEKVSSLTAQMTTNAHMVAAFEQSLSSMTARLQQLNASLEMKDCEMDRLRNTIETLKKQGCALSDTNRNASKQSSNANKVKTASLIRRHTFTNEGKGEDSNSRISRQLSVESVSSVSSGADSSISHKSKKKSEKSFNHSSSGWLRSSFSKAFKKNKSNVKREAFSDAEIIGNGSGNEGDSSSVPNSPLISFRTDPRTNGNDHNESEMVQELRRQLREKDMVLTDLRLESLTSAHQLENLKETVNQLRAEMLNLKQDNDRLKRLVSSKSLASSQSSMTSGIYGQNGHPIYGSTFFGRQNGNVSENDANSIKSLEMEAVTNALLCDGGKLVTVETGTHIIASLIVTPKTNWEQLDLMIKKSFKNYISRIDSGLGLGLTLDALACYQVGSEKIQRDIFANKSSSQPTPELLPFGYIVSESHIFVQFKSASDSLVFDTLTPKSIIQRYINLLNEHRRMILCGPSGSGKTNMAHKLAEYLAIKRAIDNQHPGTALDCCPVGSIATFSVDHKSAKELRAYLTNVAEQCESETLSLHLPTVIILDNLHHIGAIDEVFNGLINITHTKCPYIIGTMNQTTCTTANLQLHHNFRWVLCTNNMEPVKGFLGRYLKRKLIETEVRMASNNLAANPELSKIIDWIPKLWNHLNQFLESHSSSDVTIGPRLFSSCPIDINGSQVWFADLWNFSIIPYVIEATREGIQMYGQRTPFVDPSEWVCESYPWHRNCEWFQKLLKIRAEDINYENSKQNNSNDSESLAHSSSDPLLNMLRRLQEAANHSTNYSDSSQANQSYNQNNGNPNNNTTSVSIVNTGIESTL